ncbi:MAG: YciI family protein [Blastocatellia bacterium]|nr:YciI family protein [Blastocatellia bacterium]
MRFIMLAIREGHGSAAPAGASSVDAAAKMMGYNKSLQKAGVLLALDGLLPPSTGVRISYMDGKPTVTHGPFAESKEVIGGYWIIQVRSLEEAIEWAKRAPASNNEVIEVRQIHEMSGFPEDAQKAAEGLEQLTR